MMKKKMTDAMDELHMDEDCVRRIETAMEEKNRKPVSLKYRPVIAALLCVVLVVGMFAHPATGFALEEAMERIKAYFSSSFSTAIVEQDRVYYNDGRMEIHSSSDTGTVGTMSSEVPSWLVEMDGRIYFLGSGADGDVRNFLDNKESYDITEQFSQEEPFTATFDRDGVIHCIAVGGTYDPAVGISSIGYAEWLRKPGGSEDVSDNWIGGTGIEPFEPGTETFAPWYAKAVVEFGIPWNLADAQKVLEGSEA